MTKYDIIICLYKYLKRESVHNPGKSEEYYYYIRNLHPNIWKNGETAVTANPDYYAVYLDICSAFFSKEYCTVQEGLLYARKYLEKYNEYEHDLFASEIDDVVKEFYNCTESEWEHIYKELIELKKEQDESKKTPEALETSGA